MIKLYRESLRPDWTTLLTEQTPRGKELETPSVIKNYDHGEIIDLDKEF